MKVYAFSALAFVAVFGLAFVVTKVATPAQKPPVFEYETASRPSRIAFLTAEAAAIGTSIDHTLGKLAAMKEPLLNPEARLITFRIVVGSKAAAKLTSRASRMFRYRTLCPGYMGSALSKHGIKVVQKFLAANGTGKLMRVSLSNKICAQVL